MNRWTVDVIAEEAPEIDDGELVRVVEQAAVTCLEVAATPPCEVAVTLTGDARIAALNETYRAVAGPTDVLSFPLDDDAGLHPGQPRHLGDVVISVERAREQAQAYGHGLDRELAFLTVHGVLHLLGYDHDDEPARRRMRAQEEAVLARVGLAR